MSYDTSLHVHFEGRRLRDPNVIVSRMTTSSTGEERAVSILRELQAAEDELIGKTVVMTDGKAGTIDHVYLDEAHGLRISIAGHDGEWPISTVKLIQN